MLVSLILGGHFSYNKTILDVNLNASCVQMYKPVWHSNQFFYYTNMEGYHLKYHDDVYTDQRGVLLPYKRLMRMCRSMGSHFHEWIDYNGVAF